MRDFLEPRPPHVLCGDFNIPRKISPHYKDMVSGYTENVPATYQSSLDKNHHRLKDNVDKKTSFRYFYG